MADAYAYWRACLAWREDPDKHQMPDFDAKRPEPGFYRGQRHEAVAIWWVGDDCYARVTTYRDGKPNVAQYNRADIIGESVFSYCCRHPIEHIAYTNFCADGRWPEDVAPRKAVEPTERNKGGEKTSQPVAKQHEHRDEPSPAHEQAANDSGTQDGAHARPVGASDRPPPAGDNLHEDPVRQMALEIDALSERAAAYVKEIGGKVDTQEKSDKIANFGVAMLELQRKAEKCEEVEKRPYQNALNAIRAKWGKLSDKAETEKVKLKAMLVPWLQLKRDRAKADEEREAKARQAARQAGEPAPLARAKPSQTVAGTQGRVALKSVTVYRLVNIKTASAYLSTLEVPPKDWVEETRVSCARLMKAGVAVPGMVAEQEDIVA
jgi:hypothetical protein